jgi:transcriptional regulator with XRE-family HTH domain
MHKNQKKVLRLRPLRERTGLSVRELARQLDIHHTNIVYWEKKDRIANFKILPKLAVIFGISVKEILGTKKSDSRNFPGGRSRLTFEAISKLPRKQQEKILDVVDALLKQQKINSPDKKKSKKSHKN